MGQRSEPTRFDQVYVLGLDANGNPRGARFSLLKDSIVSAAMDMNLRILMFQPPEVSNLAGQLPLGTVHGNGKLVTLLVPNITWHLYRRIMKAVAAAELQRDRSATQLPDKIH